MLFLTTFYSNYVALCAKEKKSLSAVAESIGLSRTAPNGWKKGKQPSEVTLEKLSQYFGVPVSELTGEDQKEKSDLHQETGLSAAKQKLLSIFDDLTDEQCEKLFGIIEEARKLL